MGKSIIFSCLDLKQSYLQIPLDEASKELTAVTARAGHYEYNSMPFGLKTAPSFFHTIINNVLIGLVGHKTHVYLAIIIMDGYFEGHLQNLTEVLDRLKAAKLTLKLEKCNFFHTSIDYLSHVIPPEGMRPQPQKLDAIKKIPPPRTVHELQRVTIPGHD